MEEYSLSLQDLLVVPRISKLDFHVLVSASLGPIYLLEGKNAQKWMGLALLYAISEGDCKVAADDPKQDNPVFVWRDTSASSPADDQILLCPSLRSSVGMNEFGRILKLNKGPSGSDAGLGFGGATASKTLEKWKDSQQLKFESISMTGTDAGSFGSRRLSEAPKVVDDRNAEYIDIPGFSSERNGESLKLPKLKPACFADDIADIDLAGLGKFGSSHIDPKDATSSFTLISDIRSSANAGLFFLQEATIPFSTNELDTIFPKLLDKHDSMVYRS